MHVPWIEFGASLLIAALSVPLVFRRIPKNPWYGVRTPRTLSGSDEEWFETNRLVGLALVITALISAAADVVLGWLPLVKNGRYAASAVLLIAAVIFPMLLYRKRLF